MAKVSSKTASQASKILKSIGVNVSSSQVKSAVKKVSSGGGSSGGSSTPVATTPTALTYAPGSLETMTKAQAEAAGRGAEYDKLVSGFNVSTTTISNDNKINNTIPDNNAKLETLGDKGLTTTADGQTTYADGTAYTAPKETKNKVTKDSDGNYYNSDGSLAEDNYDRQQSDLFDSMKASLDATTKASIDAIQQQYAVRKQQTEQLNKAQEAGVTAGLMMAGSGGQGGGFRYTPVSSVRIVSDQERYGVMELAQLDADENNLIAQAKAAQQTGDFKIMEAKLNLIEKKREEKAEAAKKLNEQIAEANKALIQSTRDSAIADLMSQGVTDGATMLDYLNYDEKGNRVGDFTAKEVADAVENIAKMNNVTTDKLTGEAKNYYVLKDVPGALPASVKDLGSYLKWNKALTTSSTAQDQGYTGEGGFEKFSNESIALSVIPSTLRNSDVELKRYLEGIRLGLAQGKTPYEIADNLMGYKIENPDSFSDGLRPYLSLANLNGPEIANVARLINGGNKASAIALLENKILENQKKIDPESYVGEATPRYYVDKVAQIKKTIADAGLTDKIGPLEGTFQQVLSKLKSSEAAKIQAQVTNLVAEMRLHFAGTAMTDSEKAFLDPLIASLSDKKGIFMNKLDEIASNSLSRYNETRKSGGIPSVDENQLLNRSARVSLYSNGSSDMNNPIDMEVQDTSSLQNYIAKNPTAEKEITTLITKMEEALGRQINASEFLQAYPKYK